MANKGQQVKIKYTGTFDDGTVFDATDMHDGEPLEFTAGVGQVIPGFDAAVLDMEVGEKRDVVIEAVDGYGEYNPELLQSEKIENIPDGAELAKRVGQTVLFQNGGEFFQALVVSAENGSITVDFNHPLAGKRLHFSIELLEANDQEVPAPGEAPAPGQTA